MVVSGVATKIQPDKSTQVSSGVADEGDILLNKKIR